VRFHEEEASLEALIEGTRSRPPAGIIAVGDRPTVLAARLTQALRLPGHPPDAADATRSKKRMRERFAAAGMRTPWNFQVEAGADVFSFVSRVIYPCVVKSLGLAGSRGVIRADDQSQLQAAIERVRALLARPDVQAQRTGLTDKLLIEGYIEGREYAVEGLLTDGRLRVLAIFDKPDPLDGPFFEETIYVTPPLATERVRASIELEVERAVAALGLTHGPVHAECRAGAAGVTMLEVAARPIGGLCSRVLRFDRGDGVVPLEEVLLRHAVGEDVSAFEREASAAGVMMIPIPRRGVYKGVGGLDRASAVPGVEEIRITAKLDQLLEPLTEGDSYLGFIFARAATADEAVAALRTAHATLTFQIDPELRVIR
jgi:biotin carboxylase